MTFDWQFPFQKALDFAVEVIVVTRMLTMLETKQRDGGIVDVE